MKDAKNCFELTDIVEEQRKLIDLLFIAVQELLEANRTTQTAEQVVQEIKTITGVKL